MSQADYFTSYADISVHSKMLKDKPRMAAYAAALEALGERLQGATVMDVGSGTGILSMIAARNGARKVYAVEASDFANVSREVIEANGLSSIIEVIKARVEDVQIDEKVDIIVSEWMGFHLLHESMLDSVLFARDKFLKEGGLMLPESAQIFMAPVNMAKFSEEHFECWQDYMGFDLTSLVPLEVEKALQVPQITEIVPENLLADPQLVAFIGLNFTTVEEVHYIMADLKFPSTREGICHGMCIWFSVQFPMESGQSKVELSTAPGCEQTHWEQTVVLLPEMLWASPGNIIPCKVTMTPDLTNPRHCVIALDLSP